MYHNVSSSSSSEASFSERFREGRRVRSRSRSRSPVLERARSPYRRGKERVHDGRPRYESSEASGSVEHPHDFAIAGPSKANASEADHREHRSVSRKATRRIRELFVTGIPSSKVKDFRNEFQVSFDHKSFELTCPELDDSMARRLRQENSTSKTTALATEKSLVHHQKKLLDVVRPIIDAWSQLLKNDPLKEALNISLQLCGEAFHFATKQRGNNILKITDPSFINLLKDPSAFSVKESGRLFGS